MRTTKTRRGVAVLLGAALAVPVATAGAAPKDQIRSKRAQAVRAQAEARRLGDALEPIIQRHNEATIKLGTLRTSIADNRRQIRIVERNVERGRELLARRLVEDYRNGEPDAFSTILASGSLTEMLAAADLYKRSENQAFELVRRLQEDRRELAARRARLRRDEARAGELVRELAAQAVRIRAGIARQKQLVRGLEREIAQLEAEERERQRRLVIAARRRLEAARRAAAAAEAAAERRRLSAPDPGIGGSIGTPPPARAGTPAPSARATPRVSEAPATAASGSGGAQPAAAPAATIAPPPPPSDGSIGMRAVAAAMRWVGTPYSWGGGGPSGPTRGIGRGSGTVGFDCSGLTLYAYAQVGISLSHFTGAQWNQGTRISSMSSLRPGDLVFFGSDLGHMGMYVGGGQMIHAPRTGDVVKISSITGSGYYSSRFRGGVRPY